MAISTGRKFYENYTEILVNHEGLSAPTSLTLDPTKVGLNTQGDKMVEPGEFLAEVAGVGRKLPRTLLAAASATNSATVTVANASPFVADDVLVGFATGIVTLSGTWAAEDTLEVVIGAYSQTYTAADNSQAAVATAAVAAFNAGVLGKVASFYALGSAIYVQMDNLIPVTMSATATTAGTGDATVTAIADQALGTVASVSGNVITLDENADTAMPTGLRVGIAGAVVKGLNIRPTDLLSTKDVETIGCYICANVNTERLPYLDGEIKAQFPKLSFL